MDCMVKFQGKCSKLQKIQIGVSQMSGNVIPVILLQLMVCNDYEAAEEAELDK